MIEYVLDNQFLVGGVVVILLTALRKVPGLLWDFVLSQCSVFVQVSNQDETFYWIERWICSLEYGSKMRRSRVSTRGHRSIDRSTVLLTPARGVHVFRWNGKWVYVRRAKLSDKTIAASDNELASVEPESFYIRVLFSRNPIVTPELIEEARTCFFPNDGELCVYVPYGWSWSPSFHASRYPEQLSLSQEVRERVILDARWFVESRDLYKKHGVPWHRGYLLHGPPGNGKSSLVKAVASDLGMPLYTINIASMDDERLSYMMSKTPIGSVVVLEDIERALKDISKDQKKKVTMGGLLNVLDGPATSDGKLVFMTCNDSLGLDQALVRKGRVDQRVQVDDPNEDQIAEMIRLFESDLTVADVRKRTGKEKCNSADVQKVLLEEGKAA